MNKESSPVENFHNIREVIGKFSSHEEMLLKGGTVAETFYPFVENGEVGASDAPSGDPALVVQHSARIAVFDDPSAAPRVVVVEPSDIRTFLEEITATVTRLAQEQGGKIPFTVIREVVENLIHAYFLEPTISILDGGNTIRFSDQGPGIVDKRRALQYGTTSATTEMKRYIRGVGSGLPYAQQWLEGKGGSLTVEDNIHRGTVVTVSLIPSPTSQTQELMPPTPFSPQQQMNQATPAQWQQVPQGVWPQQAQMPQAAPMPAAAQGYPMQPTAMPQGYGYYQPQPQPMMPNQYGYYQPQPAMPTVQNPWQQPAPGMAPTAPAQYGTYQPQPGMPTAEAPTPTPSPRGLQALDYLRTYPEVGPNDLTTLYGGSNPTWSRELKLLESQGLIAKQGQKRRLTPQGRQYLGL